MLIVGRRRALVDAAGVAAGVGALAGCGSVGIGNGSGAPKAHFTGTVVSFAPNWQGPWSPSALSLVQQVIHEHFETKHHGVHVKVVASTEYQAATQITAAIAGNGFIDVFNDCCTDLPTWMDSGMMLPLDPYLRRDNISTSLWSAGRIKALTLNGRLLGLPAYDGPEVMVYRQDMLDTFGLKYPNPDWTYVDALALWQQCARRKGTQTIYGASLDNWSVNIDYLMHGWGGSVFNANHTRCAIDSAACIKAGSWLFGAIQSGAVSPTRDQVGGLVSGKDVFAVCGGWDTFWEATALGTKFKWNILPQPKWPVQRAVMVNSDFLAIDARTKNPDAAWELLRWVSTDPTWTRFVMHTILTEPALISLWSEWETVVQQAAPPFKGKNLQYYREAALGGYEVPQSFFLYSGNQATTIMSGWWSRIQNRSVSVQEGFRGIAQQINALEAAGVTGANALSKTKSELAKVAKTGKYTTPLRRGQGNPFTPAPTLMLAHAGAYTMLGDGYDIYLTQDACTFFCLPQTAAEGHWTCRVKVISNLTCPSLSPWAKIGLMARGDLSDDAPMVSVHVTGGNEVEWQERPLAGMTPGGQSGILPAGFKGPLLKPANQPTPNFLARPVWLRLQRVQGVWSGFVSLDGTKWTPAGKPASIELAGAWVGLMCTAHNADFTSKGYIRAVFDHVSFIPTDKVQLGVNGVPPAAGTVPANWATMATGTAPPKKAATKGTPAKKG